ncbi:GPR endopeptidase [bacterium BFN5]|nr:GPR endopeptidase [bacterium BFN5]
MEHMNTPRTDLALEAREMITKNVSQEVPGVMVETSEDDEILITRVNITTPEAEQRMGKTQGRYVTIEAQGLRYKKPTYYRGCWHVVSRGFLLEYRPSASPNGDVVPWHSRPRRWCLSLQ